MQQKPLLLIDVDGVLSLWGFDVDERPDGVWTLIDGVPHFLAAGPARRLNALLDRLEPVWCTGWEERADEHLPHHLGLGPFPHLSFDRHMAGASSFGHWKLGAIDAHAGPDRALVWVDDAFTQPCWAWAAARPGPTLLVETSPAEGFTAGQADDVAAWVRSLDA